MEEDFQHHFAQYMPGSCDWVLLADQFRQWYDTTSEENRIAASQASGKTTSNNTLTIVGPPGSGKSTMAAYLIHFLSQSGRTLYFFFNRQDPEKQNATIAIRSLLGQLLGFKTEVADRLRPAYQRSGSPVAHSYTELSRLFQEIVSQLSHENGGIPYYVVLDGVEECESRYLLYQCFFDYLPHPLPIKFLFTARGSNSTSPEAPSSNSLVMSLGTSCAAEHIKLYAEARVRKLPAIADTALGEYVILEVSQRANGLWLYARLLLDEIERAPSREVVEQLLKAVPDGLAGLYHHILVTNGSQMTKFEKRFAQYLFLCVDISDFMPNFLAKTMDTLQQDTLDLMFRFVNGGNKPFDIRGLAAKLGSPLVEVYPDDQSHGADYEAKFVHSSIYQYVADAERARMIDTLPPLIQPRRAKGLYRGDMAVWYFTKCPDSQIFLDELQNMPINPPATHGFDSYFPMTYCLWDTLKMDCRNLQNLPGCLSTETDSMLQTLSAFLKSEQCLRWFELSTIINYSGNYRELLDNVLSALDVAIRNTRLNSATPEMREFIEQRAHFLGNWKYIVLKTTPWKMLHDRKHAREYPTPADAPDAAEQLLSGFHESSIGLKMMEIADKWSKSVDMSRWRDPAESDRSRITMCSDCSAIMSRRHFGKHEQEGCRARKRRRVHISATFPKIPAYATQ